MEYHPLATKKTQLSRESRPIASFWLHLQPDVKSPAPFPRQRLRQHFKTHSNATGSPTLWYPFFPSTDSYLIKYNSLKIHTSQKFLTTSTSPFSGECCSSRASKSGSMCMQFMQQYVKKSSTDIRPLRSSSRVSERDTLNHSNPEMTEYISLDKIKINSKTSVTLHKFQSLKTKQITSFKVGPLNCGWYLPNNCINVL